MAFLSQIVHFSLWGRRRRRRSWKHERTVGSFFLSPSSSFSLFFFRPPPPHNASGARFPTPPQGERETHTEREREQRCHTAEFRQTGEFKESWAISSSLCHFLHSKERLFFFFGWRDFSFLSPFLLRFCSCPRGNTGAERERDSLSFFRGVMASACDEGRTHTHRKKRVGD